MFKGIDNQGEVLYNSAVHLQKFYHQLNDHK